MGTVFLLLIIIILFLLLSVDWVWLKNWFNRD